VYNFLTVSVNISICIPFQREIFVNWDRISRTVFLFIVGLRNAVEESVDRCLYLSLWHWNPGALRFTQRLYLEDVTDIAFATRIALNVMKAKLIFNLFYGGFSTAQARRITMTWNACGFFMHSSCLYVKWLRKTRKMCQDSWSLCLESKYWSPVHEAQVVTRTLRRWTPVLATWDSTNFS